MSKYNLGFRYVIQEIENFDIGTIIECENGNRYELRIAENGQRKYTRKNRTKLRFMTYDNIDKMFRIVEDEIDIQSIEELNHYDVFSAIEGKQIENINDELKKIALQQNKILEAVKQLDRKSKIE